MEETKEIQKCASEQEVSIEQETESVQKQAQKEEAHILPLEQTEQQQAQEYPQAVPQEESSELQEQVKELTEENEMLFEQLHIVQEELEKYYYKLKDAEKKAAVPVVAGSGGVAEVKQISDAYCKYLEKNLEMSNSLRFSEMHNSLQYRIGNAIIKLKDSGVSAPFKLWAALSFFSNTKAPSSLGGNNFTKVIEAYEKGKEKALKDLLNGVKITSIVKANAYTALAKHYQHRDLSVCVKFASMAYKTDPQAYRLKWWLLRLDDRGDYNTACALVGLLPKDTPMKDVEKVKIDPIRRKAEQLLQQKMHTVKVNSVAPETQKKLDASLKENKKLKDELAAQKKTSENLKQEVHTLKADFSNQIKPCDELKKENAALEERYKVQTVLATAHAENLDNIKKSHEKLTKKNAKYKRKIAELQGRLGQMEKTVTLVQDEKIKLLQEVLVGKK